MIYNSHVKNQFENLTEKSQTELREALNERFSRMKNIIRQVIDEYKTALKDGVFEDAEGEEDGSGVRRREIMQNKINGLFDRAEQMKEKLNSKEKLQDFTESIFVNYTNPDKKVENIVFSFEQKLQDYIDFYKTSKLDLPPDFENSIREIWENNLDDIQKAIEENGFDDMLLMPADIPLPGLNTKMTEGYKNATYEGSNFSGGGGLQGAKSQNVDKPRIVLVHKTQNLKDRPELAKTLNIKGEDAIKSGILTLEDYLVFQRKYFKETGKHLDEIGATWLATYSGVRLVDASWDPYGGQVSVSADALDYRHEILGARPSRSFF